MGAAQQVVEADPLTAGLEWGIGLAKAAAAGLMRRGGLTLCYVALGCWKTEFLEWGREINNR